MNNATAGGSQSPRKISGWTPRLSPAPACDRGCACAVRTHNSPQSSSTDLAIANIVRLSLSPPLPPPIALCCRHHPSRCRQHPALLILRVGVSAAPIFRYEHLGPISKAAHSLHPPAHACGSTDDDDGDDKDHFLFVLAPPSSGSVNSRPKRAAHHVPYALNSTTEAHLTPCTFSRPPWSRACRRAPSN